MVDIFKIEGKENSERFEIKGLDWAYFMQYCLLKHKITEFFNPDFLCNGDKNYRHFILDGRY